MPEDDGVAVCFDHPDRVREGLPLLDRRAFRAAEAQRTPAEARHRALERQPGSCRRFVEERGQDLAFEGPGTLLPDRDRDHFAGGPQNELRSEEHTSELQSPYDL